MSKTFMKVGRYPTLPLARIAVGRLAAEGIDAFVPNEHFAQLLPGVLGPVPVMVHADDEAAARRILDTDYSDDLDGSDETT